MPEVLAEGAPAPLRLCRGIHDDLGRFLNGDAIAVRPEGRLDRLTRRARRRPVLTAVLVTVTLIMVALIGGGLWMLSERRAAAHMLDAERVATEVAAKEDLRDMVRWLNQSSWSEARATLERAKTVATSRRTAPPPRSGCP